MQSSTTADPTMLQGNVLVNLMAGMGDGSWTSRAGVVLNPNTVFTKPSAQLTSTHSATTLNGGNLPFAQYAAKSASENILLSPQHFIESSNMLSNESSSNSYLLQNGGINPKLLSLDISASNFTKAMKFNGVQTDDASESETGDVEDEVDGGFEDQVGFSDNIVQGDGSSEYEEQSIVSEGSNDPGDEQNKLMDRFKQLRQWQVQQQELLMLQQQQQLEALRGEQEKVQRMIQRQREAGDIGQGSVLSHLPPVSPKKSTAQMSKQSTTNRPTQRTPPSRPKPNLPSIASTPTEYRENGNPNLDSDTASTCTANTHDVALDEGVLPLPETATDMAEFLQRKKILLQKQQGNCPAAQKSKPGICSQPSQFLKQIAPNGEFPRKVLNFDPSETESQADFAGLRDVESHSQFSQTQRPQNFSQKSKQDGFNGIGTEGMAVGAGYTSLLNVPGIMQSLPETILHQLLSLQQQGHNVVVDANGQLAVLPTALTNGSNQHVVGSNPLSRLAGQNDSGANVSERNSASVQSLGFATSHDHQSRFHGHESVPESGLEYTDSPPVHDQEHGRSAENKVLDFREREDDLVDAGKISEPEDDPDEVGSYRGKVLHGQNRGGHRRRVEGDANGTGPYTGKVLHGHKGGEGVFEADVRECGTTGRMLDHTEHREDMEQVDEDQVVSSEDSEEEEEEADDDSVLKASGGVDDMPVGGLGARKKTFEELLEEELRREEQRLQQGETGTQDPQAPKRKQFLRKGEGSARFGVNGKPPKRPQPVKRKSGVKASATGGKSGNQGATAVPNRNATDKKQSTNRKVAPSRTKPPEKLQLKPSPKKPTKPTASKAGSELSSTDVKVNAEKVSKTGHRVKGVGSKKLRLMNNKQKPASSDGSSDTGDVSFQARLHEIAKKEEVEHEELEEFEILEQFADDNVSFLSNLSAVNRALNYEKAAEERRATAGSMGPKSKPSGPGENDDTVVENIESEDETAADLTLIEDTDNMPQLIDGDSENIKNATHSRFTDNNDDDSQTVANNPILAKLKAMKPMQRKVVSLGERTRRLSQESVEDCTLQLSRVEQFSDSDSETETVSARNAGIGRIEEKKILGGSQNVDVKVSDTNVNKSAMQDTGTVKGSGSKQEHKHWGAANSRDNMKEAKMSKNLRKEENNAQESGDDSEDDTDFGDGEVWEDESKGEDDWDKEFLKSRKDRQPQGKQSIVVVSEEEGRQTPPTSKLVSKLFPKLKAEQPKVSKHQSEKLSQAEHTEVGDGVQARQLRDKLVELEREIERFRGENGALEKLRREREEGLDHLKREMSEFQKQKDQELKRIQDYKAEETRKLKRERKLFEDYQKSIRNMPNKKERDEIEALKQQISDLQDEMKRKETRWTSSTTRLRDRIEQLEQENGELREELRVIEQKRLEVWQQKEALVNANKVKQSGDALAATTGSQSSQKSSQLKKSSSGPQLSARSLNHRQHEDLPEPVKQGSGTTLQRDHKLRLSTTAELIHGAADTMSAISADSEAIHPEDSASNVIANRLTQPHPHPREQTHRLSLKSSTESKDSDHQYGGVSSKKAITRKKVSGASVSHTVEKGDGQYEEVQHQDGKVERIYTNGAREILFSNGTRKQVSSDGQSIIVSFFNGDVKQILPDQRVVYYYSEAETTHTTYPDGLEILQFANQQSEKHYPDGTKEITFPDQTVKYLFPNGIEESIFADGTVIRVEKSGDKTMEFPNGQREIHTPQYKRREYPDGTVKTVYPDGRQETRYSSGRIRVKDKEGVVIVDRRV